MKLAMAEGRTQRLSRSARKMTRTFARFRGVYKWDKSYIFVRGKRVLVLTRISKHPVAVRHGGIDFKLRPKAKVGRFTEHNDWINQLIDFDNVHLGSCVPLIFSTWDDDPRGPEWNIVLNRPGRLNRMHRYGVEL